jgi:dephospho-CoA kinase
VLGQRVFGDDHATNRLEAIIHPLVGVLERRFLARAAARHNRLAVLDVPLMFETGGEDRCHVVAVVVAPAFVQAQRVLRRPGMTLARLDAIRARQMPDREKVRLADFVIRTGLGRRSSLRDIHRMVRMLHA